MSGLQFNRAFASQAPQLDERRRVNVKTLSRSERQGGVYYGNIIESAVVNGAFIGVTGGSVYELPSDNTGWQVVKIEAGAQVGLKIAGNPFKKTGFNYGAKDFRYTPFKAKRRVPKSKPTPAAADELAVAVQVPQPREEGPSALRLAKAFVAVCERWGVTEYEQCQLAGGILVSVSSQLQAKHPIALNRDQRDRLTLLFRISVGLGFVLANNEAAEREWMRRSNPALEDRAPLSVLLTGGILDFNLVNSVVDELRGL